MPLLLLPALPAAEKKLTSGKAANDNMEIAAKVYVTKAEVDQLLGGDYGGTLAVVEIKVTPKGEKPIGVVRDDFTLLSHKDGARSQPFEPTQIAGKSALVIGSRPGGGGGMMSQGNGPVWGPTVGGGPPRRLGGNGGAIGSAGGPSEAQATVKDGAGEKDDPRLATLKARILEEKEIESPLSGLLYFPIEGKLKPKDFSLLYRSPAGRLTITFE